MTIKEVTPATIHFVETDEAEIFDYVRYSADNWTVLLGESYEPFWDCQEIEKKFQESQQIADQ